MHTKQFWILTLVLLQFIFLVVPTLALPQGQHASKNQELMADTDSMMKLNEGTPMQGNQQTISPQSTQDVTEEEIQRYLDAQETVLPLPSGEIDLVPTVEGLEKFAQFLSYKMPENVWKSFIARGKTYENYLKVLDPKRVNAIYGESGPTPQAFINDLNLLSALETISTAQIAPRNIFSDFSEQEEKSNPVILRLVDEHGQEIPEPPQTTEKKPELPAQMQNSGSSEEVQQPGISSEMDDIENPNKYPKRTDPVKFNRSFKQDYFGRAMYLSYAVDEEEWKKEIEKAKQETGDTEKKWKEVLDINRVKDFYIYGPGSVYSGDYSRDFGIHDALEAKLKKYYEITYLPPKDPKILAKYPPRVDPVDKKRRFKNLFEVGHYLSRNIPEKELQELISKADKENQAQARWNDVLDEHRVKEFLDNSKDYFFIIERFKDNEPLFFALRDNKLLRSRR